MKKFLIFFSFYRCCGMFWPNHLLFYAQLGIKAGLSSPLTALFGNEYIARSVRYFLIVVFAGVLWPLTFKLFGKMQIKQLDAFGVKVACIFNKELRQKVAEEKAKERKRYLREKKKRNRKK